MEMCKRACIGTGHLSGYVYPMHRKRKSTPHIWNYFVYNNKRIYVDTTFMAKGRTRNTTSTRELDHKRALKDIARKNKKKSVVNDFDDFYFDFSYKKEQTETIVVRNLVLYSLSDVLLLYILLIGTSFRPFALTLGIQSLSAL